ncbi:MAG: hypothetical protein IJV36_05430 [Prevotella sp.]|nr:hypothetical protein [Prevotella sp.]
MRHKVTLLAIALLMVVSSLTAANTQNARQARKIFDHTFQLVFGAQGCTLHYDVNLVGVYKTNGNIWYKGKKSKFVEGRYLAWNDGQSYYLVDKKKRSVTIHDAESDEKDKYSSNFKFSPEDYNYSVETTAEGYLLTLKLKQGRKGMKLVKALVDKKTRAPISLRIKVAFFWANINITNFKSGGINDDVFRFPRKDYAGYALTDKRGKRD